MKWNSPIEKQIEAAKSEYLKKMRSATKKKKESLRKKNEKKEIYLKRSHKGHRNETMSQKLNT